jgi:4-hydroxy-4-methyl-2-oxoglutarate aldolase
MTAVEEEIIKRIHNNRISTSQVSDCLGKTGAIQNVVPINFGHFRIGRVRFAYAHNCSNWELHEQLQDVRPGEVVVVEAIDCGDYAVFGSLVTKFLILYRNAAAVIVNGLLRDHSDLRRWNWPVWSRGYTPIGCFNVKNEMPPDPELLTELRQHYDGTIAVCDDSGAVIIGKEHINEDFLEKLDIIEIQEDAWFHSIDTDKFTTYETVCLKKYLREGSMFSRYDKLKKGLGSA